MDHAVPLALAAVPSALALLRPLPPAPRSSAGAFPATARPRTITPPMRLDELLARARAHDSVALDELYRRYYPQVRDAVHRRLARRLRPQGHPMLAMLSTGDIVHDVFEEVLRSLDAIDGSIEARFSGFLTTLVEHRLVDQLRRHHAAQRDVRRQVELDTSAAEHAERPPEPDPGARAAELEQHAIYRDVLAGFPPRQRAVLALRLEDEAPFQRIADELAYPSADAARKAFHEARALMLVRLGKRGVSPGGGAR